MCLWQNHELLHIINKPLTEQTSKQVPKVMGPSGRPRSPSRACSKLARDTQGIVGVAGRPTSGVSAHTRAQLPPQIPRLQADVAKIPRHPQGTSPVTLGIGEPFTTTISGAPCSRWSSRCR